MQDWEFSVVALVGLAGAWLAASSSTPASPALVGRSLGPETAELEALASAHPEDAAALLLLADHYLDHGAPGLARAALDRAPTDVRDQPQVTDALARATWDLGFVSQALELQRSTLRSCTLRPCSYALVGRAQRRERLLTELDRLGVEDPKRDPDRALLAYWRSTREVRLDIR